MRVLHDVAIVTDELISVRPPSGMLVLHESLRDGYERVRLSLEPLSLEDVTKVWTALALRYRLSAAYTVNVVQIESRRGRTFPQPVGQPASPTLPPLPSDPPSAGPWIYVFPIQTPTISELRVRRAGATRRAAVPVRPRSATRSCCAASALAGPRTFLAFGDVRVPTTFASPLRVEAAIPDATVIGTGPIAADQQLQPGVRTVKVDDQRSAGAAERRDLERGRVHARADDPARSRPTPPARLAASRSTGRGSSARARAARPSSAGAQSRGLPTSPKPRADRRPDPDDPADAWRQGHRRCTARRSGGHRRDGAHPADQHRRDRRHDHSCASVLPAARRCRGDRGRDGRTTQGPPTSASTLRASSSARDGCSSSPGDLTSADLHHLTGWAVLRREPGAHGGAAGGCRERATSRVR